MNKTIWAIGLFGPILLMLARLAVKPIFGSMWARAHFILTQKSDDASYYMRKVIKRQHRAISLCFGVQRQSFSLIWIWKKTNRNGFLGNDANLRSDWDHRVPLHQNLLQQRTFCQSISPNFGYYCNNLLLDDEFIDWKKSLDDVALSHVGDCVSSTDEATHSTYTE